jgi:[acyl-carrier-protein] S-malonyltransferase
MIAFTFPGQGSQRPGAGTEWVHHPAWDVVRAASDAARMDLAHLLLDADAEELRRTDNAQLATYTASLVVLDAARRLGLDASFVAGHSLGEYTALTAAGALPLDDGVRLVAARGAAMRDACTANVGTMAAVLGADDSAVEAACADVRATGSGAAAEVWVANYNAPGQVVIAGSPEGIDAVTGPLKAAGAKRVMPISVAGAFHTPYMAPASGALDAALTATRFAGAHLPVANNVDAVVREDRADWAGLLSHQLCSPVRWTQSLAALAAAGADTFVELGPGTVLTGLAKRAVDGAEVFSAQAPAELDQLAEALSARSLAAHEGETLFAAERVVVAPAAGVFEPHAHLTDGAAINEGDLIGRIGDHEVRSRFSGFLMGVMAWRGERVAVSQPLLWLRIF